MEGKFTITTKAFEPNGPMPVKYTCFGENVNPDLSWTNPPAGTKSFALINDDPDTPVGLITHWLVKNIPPTTTHIPENSVPGDEIESIGGTKKYKGPKPPYGTHRYFFKLYALKVEKMQATTLKEFYEEVEKEKIDEAVVIGTFTAPEKKE